MMYFVVCVCVSTASTEQQSSGAICSSTTGQVRTLVLEMCRVIALLLELGLELLLCDYTVEPLYCRHPSDGLLCPGQRRYPHFRDNFVLWCMSVGPS